MPFKRPWRVGLSNYIWRSKFANRKTVEGLADDMADYVYRGLDYGLPSALERLNKIMWTHGKSNQIGITGGKRWS